MQKKIKRGDPFKKVQNERGDPFKKVQNERGDPLETKIFQKKVAQCRKKIERGDSVVPSGFVGYLEKGLH